MIDRRDVLISAVAATLYGYRGIAAEWAGQTASIERASGAEGDGGLTLQVPGWDGLIDDLRDLPSRMLATLPPQVREDPQVQQEVGRLVLAALSSSAMVTLGAGGNYPFFLPQLNMLQFAGQPNPDTLYRFTPITPGGSYRIRGQGGDLCIAMLSQMSPRAKVGAREESRPVRSYHDFSTLRRDSEGRFDVLISPEKPSGYNGDWWELQPTTNRLQIRFVRQDWAREREPTIAIERVDGPASSPRPSADVMEARLEALRTELNFLAPLFVDKVERLRRECGDNRMQAFDVSVMGGLSEQFYWEGPFDLREDEALILEATEPKCLYRSAMVTNETYDTIDWYNNHSCLNASQAPADADGILRLVVAPKDPGVPNWLDTAGHLRGLVQGRWFEADAHPIPSAKVVPLAEVRKHLPPETAIVTPAQRDSIVRERRSILQQRSLW